MKLHAIRPPVYHSGPNMTPLVDVVMVVLVFLMLAGSFGAADHYLSARMADRGSAAALPAVPPGDKEVLEVLMSRGRGGAFAAHAGDIRAADAGTLSSRLEAKRRLYARHGTPVEDIRLVIRPTADVPYDHVAAAYDAALRAGYTDVAFATSR